MKEKLPITLVVATTNRGKLAEFRELLADLPLEVVGVGDILSDPPRIVEDGATFHENAMKKALTVARAASMLTLADDSGLEVDALDGAPGIRSARFAGERATDAENNALLLSALAGVSDDRRTARFRCVLVLVDPFSRTKEPNVVACEGACEGWIAREARGTAGFGYDPLFIVDAQGRTMAELADLEKNAISHRAAAFRQLRPLLQDVLARYNDDLSFVSSRTK